MSLPTSLKPELIGKVVIIQIIPLTYSEKEDQLVLNPEKMTKHVGKLQSYMSMTDGFGYCLEGLGEMMVFSYQTHSLEFYEPSGPKKAEIYPIK